MTRHTLQGRSESEVLWFQRREAIAAAIRDEGYVVAS